MKPIPVLTGALAVALSVPTLALPHWWVRQALCIHRHEAVNWHERRNPTYRGGMQFHRSTWARAGGHGDPADATPREQLRRAYVIWKMNGGSWREWSTASACGLR